MKSLIALFTLFITTSYVINTDEVLPYPDNSLHVEQYQLLGMPSPDEVWNAAEYKRAVKVIKGFYNIDKWSIPRKNSDYSGDLFEKIKTSKLAFKASELPKVPTGKYVLPCLTSSFNNQGLNYFAPKDEATILKEVISIPSNSDVYRAYFQSREFTVLSDAYTINWVYDGMKLTSNQYLFTVPCINKVTDLKIYSYKNKLGGWNVARNKQINLPTKDNLIDYKTMETLISAIKKLVIKDVVLYTNKKLDA